MSQQKERLVADLGLCTVNIVTHLLAAVGNRDRTAGLDAMEEPFLNWVVVKGPVDVDRAHASEGNALVCQQLLSVQFALPSHV